MIFREATVKHLGMARILVFAILLIDLLVDNLPTMAAMPAEAYLPRGVFKLVPQEWLPVMFQASTLTVFSWCYGLLLVMGLVGLGPAWLVTGLTLVGTTFFHGVARGFGGHVNHQELITLHACFFLLARQSFDRLSLNSFIRHREKTAADDEISRLLLRGLCFWILLTYFFIGMARIQGGDWRVYSTNAMTFYAAQHSLKWNYWGFSMARDILQQPILSMLLTITFPFATVLELGAIFSVFFRVLVWPVILSLFLFHISILLFMNIFFWQNMLLLLLPLLGWWVDRKRAGKPAEASCLTVYYDGGNAAIARLAQRLSKGSGGPKFNFTAMDMTQVEKDENPLVVINGDERLTRSAATLKILSFTHWADFAEFVQIFPVTIREYFCRLAVGWYGRSQRA